MLALPLSAFADTTEKVSSETSAIQSNEITNPNPGFYPQEKISAEKMEFLQQIAPPNPVNEVGSNEFSIQAAEMSYTITKLSTGNSLTSISSFALPAGKKPTITLTQSPYSGGGTVTAIYTLVNVNTNNEISDFVRVPNNYTGTNYSYTFNNVPAGTYKVKISNLIDSPDMKGNGYITLL